MNSFGKLKVLDIGTSEYQLPEHYREKHLKLQVRMNIVQLKKQPLIMVVPHTAEQWYIII
jgi:hypothetical protein